MPGLRQLTRYFVEGEAPTVDEADAALWSEGGTSRPTLTDQQTRILFEQYKLYVELADRVSARRALANSFFLSLNTAISTAAAIAWFRRPEAPVGAVVLTMLILVGQCLVWNWVVRSYRQLSAGKWAVVGAFERGLPTSPWWGAEWAALGAGVDPSRYWPLTRLEQWVPFLFAAVYSVGFVGLILT